MSIVSTIITWVGIPAMLAALVYIGRKLQVLDTIEQDVKNYIKPEIRDLKERFVVVEDRVESLWKDRYAPAKSPRQLNAQGEAILAQSGIKEMIDGKRQALFTLIQEKHPTNAYDAEQTIVSVVSELPKYYPEMVDQLKAGAFRVGADLDSMLFVGSVYLRDQIFNELGFSLGDLDGPKI